MRLFPAGFFSGFFVSFWKNRNNRPGKFLISADNFFLKNISQSIYQNAQNFSLT